MKSFVVSLICISGLGISTGLYSADPAPGARSVVTQVAKQVFPADHTKISKDFTEPVSTGSLIQVTLGLVVVLMVIGGAAWIARRFGHFQTGAHGSLRIIGGLHMGTRERIVLVQVGEQQLLLGVAPGRIQTLHVLDKPLTTSGDIKQAPLKFADRLAAVLKRQSL